jgi:acetylserotonin N-methyltransferase
MQPLERPPIEDGAIRQLWLSLFISPTVSTALELGFFEALRARPADVATLAARLELSQEVVEALAATLASFGLLRHQAGNFCLTELSEAYLLRNSPFYWGDMFALFQEVQVDHAGMLEAFRRRGPAHFAGGVALTEGWEENVLSIERAMKITRAMHSHSFSPAIALAERYPVKDGERFLDVGGGSACVAIALAQRYPGAAYVVADLPPVCSAAKEYVERYGVGHSVSLYPFDMFREPWPDGFDYVFMANILHDWEPARRKHLVQQSFRSLTPGGRLLIYEMLLNEEQDGPATAALFSINMLYVTKGKQFRSSELHGLLQQCGFVNCVTQAVYAGYSLIQGTRPGPVT